VGRVMQQGSNSYLHAARKAADSAFR